MEGDITTPADFIDEIGPQQDKHCRRRCDSCDGSAQRGKLHCFNWLSDVPGGYADDDMVEVQFKNTRKGFYKNSTDIPLEIGDWVAVEASPGHDVGQVTMIGALVRLQMRKAGVKPDAEVKRVFRKARQSDMEMFEKAKARENETMIRSRQIAEDLKLNMKIGDVEFQGDGNKAIFYYIADERVDFRQLIKVLAESFKVRIEMKQIGARQEAGRIGGIGPCGRPLCCSSWMTNFVSVATSAARYQDISLNPQKLAGQCSKLKCCLNFEADMYVESVKRMPPREIRLETADATYFHFKTDIFKREITYSTDKSIPANLVTITAARAFEVIAMNKQGEKPVQLLPDGEKQEKQKGEYADLLGQDSLTRFDKKKRKKKKSGGGGKQKDDGEQQQPRQRQQQQGKPDGADAKASAPQQQQNQQRRRNKNRNRQRPQQSDNKDNKEG
ncbi:MAG: regulatory iron-sulfur-containing complex subunit RicT [Muribaculaceae bacterium]|nr:regulatory iron-sulfur-containing complex subunit RicT [Muribaculaceae bacterium]